MLVRLAIKGLDATSLRGSRSGHVIAAYPTNFNFGEQGEKSFFGLAMELPDDHPLILNLGGSVPAADGYKHRYFIDWTAAGISGDTLAVIMDKTKRSPWKPTKIAAPTVLRDRDSR